MFCRKFLSNSLRLSVLTRTIVNDYSNSQKRTCLNLCLLSPKNKENYGNYKNCRTGNVKFLLCFGGLLFGSTEKEKTEEEKVSDIIMTIKRSILLIQKKEFPKAEQMLHIALRQAQSLQHQKAITYIYDVMANLAFETEQYEKAEKLFIDVLQRILSAGIPQDDPKVIHISLKLAKIFEQKGDIEKADQGYKFCIEKLKPQIIKEDENEEALTLWAMTLDWYARLLLSQSKPTDAFKYFQEAYDTCVRINGEEHEQSVILLNDLGTVSCVKGEHDQAIQYFNTAIKIGEKLPEMMDLGSIYVNLGNVYIKKGLYEEATKFCRKGLKISKTRNNDESSEEASICLKEVKKLIA